MNDLIKQYEYLVDILIKKYIPSKIFDEDYKQIGLIGLWEALKKYKDNKNAKFETYASIIIKNRLIDEFRKERSDKRFLSENNNTFSLEGYYVNKDQKIALKELVEDQTERLFDTDGFIISLNNDERTIMILKSKGFSDKNIAEHLGIDRRTVAKKLKSGKEKLRQHVL